MVHRLQVPDRAECPGCKSDEHVSRKATRHAKWKPGTTAPRRVVHPHPPVVQGASGCNQCAIAFVPDALLGGVRAPGKDSGECEVSIAHCLTVWPASVLPASSPVKLIGRHGTAVWPYPPPSRTSQTEPCPSTSLRRQPTPSATPAELQGGEDRKAGSRASALRHQNAAACWPKRSGGSLAARPRGEGAGASHGAAVTAQLSRW